MKKGKQIQKETSIVKEKEGREGKTWSDGVRGQKSMILIALTRESGRIGVRGHRVTFLKRE